MTSKEQGTPIIAPSVLAANFGSLTQEISDIAAQGADWLHIDVMDGSFVPAITFGGPMVALAKKVAPALFRDVHLMIVRPEDHISTFKEAGAQRLTIHQEVSPHLHRTLGSIKAMGMSAGVCINPGTSVESIFDVLSVVDLALVMTVNPGWGGQPFLHSCVSKIETLKKEILRQKVPTLIQVDGGIIPETAKLCTQAGADVLVSGSYIFNAKNRKDAIQSLRR